ncbi:MAG: peptide chain release factor N(5)-glutamine methyltransferase [Clostridia bacterium]|nr:peptide chain release factor N(5)-glutamine methyltransferase [Clostridia bacterium]
MSKEKPAKEMPEEEKHRKKTCRTYIGGQAVLEGVMMQGRTCTATAVRDQDGNIQVETTRVKRSAAGNRARKIPFVRGIVNMCMSLVSGIKILMRSASVYGQDEEEEAGRFEKWLAEKCKVNLMDVITTVSVVIGVVLAVVIFILLPNFLVSLIDNAFPSINGSGWDYLLLGVFKLVIFVAYLALILLLKDIRRLYQYHGAEHKTINAYEYGYELTPQNVKKVSRIHDRCGTSFLFLVVIINILVLSLINWAIGTGRIENAFLRFLARVGVEVVFLPVLIGISYEVLKLLARFDNWFVTIFKSPGMLLQRALTTREPDESQIEVAIAAFNKVLEMDADPSLPETKFVTGGILTKMLEETKKEFAELGIDETDAEWIYSIVLDIPRSDLTKERQIKPSEARRLNEIIDKRKEGRPLWYVIGDTQFLDCTIKVDERVLIPRPETEQLADDVIKTAEEGDKILDLCTGSGCIAIAIAKGCASRGVSVTVTASDVSDAAITLAKENAELNGVEINFVCSDMLATVRGRFNTIVCNPPYIKSSEISELQKEVRDYEPHIALDGGEDGLDYYRRISEDIRKYLAKDGMLIMECGEGQANQILQLFPKRAYAVVSKDLEGVDRYIKIAF